MMINNRSTQTLSARSLRLAVQNALLAGAVAFTPAVFAASGSDTGTNGTSAQTQKTQSGDEYSKANHLLFMTDHLDNVKMPSKLEYGFSRQGDKNDNYDDDIDLVIRSGADQAKQVHIDFLSGDRNRYVPDVENAHGNPVIMMFLQNDVLEMAQRTGGNWRYFQRQIKFALQDDAKVEDGTAEYEGHDVNVQRVSFTPFSGEKDHRKDIGAETSKLYVVTLSKDVPGGVLELRTETPTSNDGKTQPIVERIDFEGVEQAEAASDDPEPKA